MKIISVALLFLMLIAEGVDAVRDDKRLAEMFSPILILTEETRNVYDDATVPIRVIKPEPVEIVGADSVKNVWITGKNLLDNKRINSGAPERYRPRIRLDDFEKEDKCSEVDFSANKFAFLTSDCRRSHSGSAPLGVDVPNPVPVGKEARGPSNGWVHPDHFNYPGKTAAEWNNTYFGTGAYAGENYPNTAYVHIYPTTHSNYSGTLTVIQYHYFYPYNDWWNNHEGDWQRIDVVVSSRDPDDDTIEVLGVEYRFHGAWLTYYKNFPELAGITSSFDFNPRKNIRLSQGTHPIVYVGAGSHAAYPVGGLIKIFARPSRTNTVERWEYMTHTGLVLSTQASPSNRDLWESYDLVLLPEGLPDPNYKNNMGLTPSMSWLGAQIRWGTPQVDGPELGDNESPVHGPYNSKADCFSLATIPPNCGWGELRFDEVGKIVGDLFYHKELPYESYHHWAIIGNETWSGTISLTGDVVVFPGATLTIKPGTVIEVVTSKNDRHEFSLGEGKYNLTEIFVYGTLMTESPLPIAGTAADSILFQRNDPGGSGGAWGGIHVMDGGTATLNSYTRISDTRRGKPTKLTAKVKDGQVGHIKLTWTNPKDRSIPQWEYQQKEGSADWGPWMSISGSTWSTSEHTVKGLTPGVSYQFKVRGLNRTGLAESDPSAAITAAGPPDPPELTVAAGHERVRVRWSPGADNGSKIEQHEWRYRAGEADWNPDWTVYATPEQIIRNLDNDTTYTFQMKAKNKVGYSKVVAVQATPRHPIQGPTAISVAENRDGSIASYRFAPAVLDQSLVDYRLKLSDIADSGLFALDRQGGLRFRDAPDFEVPTDGDGDGVYTVWLKAAPVSGDGPPVRRTKPLLPFTKQVDVTVTDADDPGVIKLSSRSPEVGVPLTAVLTDPDGGIAGVRWQWQRQAPGATTWQTLSAISGAASSRYIPQARQVGWVLRAVATAYRDELGAGKRAESAATSPVAAGVLSVSFGSESYQAFEGGGAVPVVVRLSPPVSQAVSIPIQVSADPGTEPGDYTVAGLNEGKVVFAAGEPASSFTITANEDADSDDETVSVSFRTPGVASAPPKATVTLHDNDATVALSSLSPQEGTQLTAEWTGPSSGITNPRWQWQRQSGPTSWTNVAGVSSQPQPWVSIYIPQAGDVGYPLRATVRYTDANGTNQRAESATTAAVRAAPPSRVNRPPSAPVGPGVVSVAENTTAIDTYISADPDGDALGWTVSPSDTFAISGGVLSFQNAPDYESGKTVYTATLKTYDGALWSPSKTVAVRVTDVNERPSAPSGPHTVSVAENTTAIGTYISTDPDGDALGWTVSPSGTFAISGGALSFQNAPDYESGITVYTATLKTYDGVLWSPSKTVTVRVTDVDEKVLDPIPLAVRDLASRSTGRTSGQASWKPPGNARAAKVRSYRYRLDSGPIQTTTTTSASFSSLQSGRRYSVDVWAVGTRGAGSTTTTTFTTDSGVAPVLAPVGPLPCYVGEYCSFTFPVATRGTEPITYKVSPPSWAKASGRSFSGTAPSSPGTASASLNASNAYGTDSESLTINIEKRPVAGVAPVLAPVGPLPCYVNEYCSFTFPVAKKGTAPITYKVSPPSWATASGRSFSGTAPSSPGTASASLNASNAYGMDSESLTINIEKRPVARVAPVLPSVSSITCYVNEYCSFTFPAARKGTAPITYKVSPPSWAKASGRSFSGTAPSSPGTASASLNASNAYGMDSESLTINIKRRPVAGVAPVLPSVSSITCYAGEYCSFTFPAATSGTAPITYKVSPPSWAKASGSRGFAGTAPNSPGTFSASINASNAYGTDSESLTINVKKRGYRPVLASVSSITCYVNEYCSFTFPAATSGTKPITYKVSPPSWATASGRGFAGPAPNSPGTFSASINASNAYGTDSESLTINVKRRLAIAPGGPSAPSAASGFVIGAIAGRIGIPARRPKSTSGPE